MAGSLGTLWARYKTLFIFWGITLVLIGAALVIQWWEADLSNRFVVTQQTTVNGIQVAVTYPSQVLLPSTNAPVQEMIFRVTAPEATKYVLWLESSQGVIFYNDRGEVVSPRWEGQGNAVFRARVQALPGRGEYLFLEARLSLDSLQYPIPLGRVVTESLGQSRWRIFGGIFARNIALPLGLLSAVAGWAVSYLAKESDKAENAFRESLSKLSTDFDSDPLFAVTQCLDLVDYAQKRHLDSENVKNLQKTVSRLYHLGNLRKITQQLSVLAEQGEEKVLLDALKRVLSFFEKFPALAADQDNGKFISSLQALYDWLKEQKPGADAIGKLWDQFDVFSMGLVVYFLNRLPRQPSAKEDIKNALEQSSHRKRLIRYQNLDWMIPTYNLTLPGEYHFPVLVFGKNLAYEVSGSFSDLFNPAEVLAESWVGPLQWERLTSPHESVSVVVLENDAEILIPRLWKELVEQQKRPRDGTFPVYWQIKPDIQSSSAIEQIAHRLAEAWIEMLPLNPDAFLDLRSAEQDALAAFLDWHVGSLPALLVRLKQGFLAAEEKTRQDNGGAQKDGNEQEIRTRERDILLDKMANSSLPYDKGLLPGKEQLLDWLNIRPPWLTHTVFIAVRKTEPSSEWQQTLSAYQRDLLRRKVVIKEVLLTDAPASAGGLVKWSDEALLDILKSRVRRVIGKESFTALFAEPPRVTDLEYDRRLVQRSNGSLGRMLELGRHVLLHHTQYHPDTEYLEADDFDGITQL